MASSGQSKGNSVSNGDYFYINWQLADQDIGDNTSTVDWQAYWHFDNSDRQLDDGDVKINGSTRWSNGGRIYNYSGNISTRNLKLASGSYTFGHNSDGTKSFTVAGSTLGYSGERSSASKSFSLPTIPRESDPVWSKSSYKIGETLLINMNRKSSSFTHTGTIQIPDGSTIKSFSGAGSSYSWTPNSTEIDDIYSRMPNTNSTSLGFDLQTKSGSTNIGGGLWQNVTITTDLTVCMPIFLDFTHKDSNSATVAITGNDQYYIQGYSTLQATISSANKGVAQKSATMNKYNFGISSINVDQAYSSSDIVKELGTLGVNTDTPLVVKAIDSRTNATAVAKTISVLPYQPPFNTVTATRLNDFETSTTIHIASVISQLTVAGTDKNAVNSTSGVQYRYKKVSDVSWGSWTNKTSSVAGANLSVTDFAVNLDRNYDWNLEVKVTDKLNTTTTALVVPKGIPIFFIGDAGQVSVNKLPEHGDLDVNGEIYAEGNKKVLVTDDTGWVTLTANSGFTSAGQIRRKNGFVTIRGQFTRNSGVMTGNDAPFTVPVGYRPTQLITASLVGSSNNTMKFVINPDGTTSVVSVSVGTGGSYVRPDNIGYYVD